MTEPALARRIAAETLGARLLLANVVGSGCTASDLTGGNQTLALLGNTLASGA